MSELQFAAHRMIQPEICNSAEAQLQCPAANYCRPKVRSTAGVSSRFGRMTDSARHKATGVIMVCQLTDSIRHSRDSPTKAKS